MAVIYPRGWKTVASPFSFAFLTGGVWVSSLAARTVPECHTLRVEIAWAKHRSTPSPHTLSLPPVLHLCHTTKMAAMSAVSCNFLAGAQRVTVRKTVRARAAAAPVCKAEQRQVFKALR